MSVTGTRSDPDHGGNLHRYQYALGATRRSIPATKMDGIQQNKYEIYLL